MAQSTTTAPTATWLRVPPRGLAILALVGPSFVWVAEYIGSGEVILATRTGSVLGTGILWTIIVGVFLKYWIGMSGARYTVCTGEGMVDMFARIPGPRNWVVWTVLAMQLIAAAVSIGSIASAAGVFLSSLIPIKPYVGGMIIATFAVGVVWSGLFEQLKVVMTLLVSITVIGVLYVTANVFTEFSTFINELAPRVPAVPEWALSQGANPNPWREILPLLGWSAGGFASQVWYTYWVLGAGYGAAKDRGYGRPADTDQLAACSTADAHSLKGWCRVVYADATIAMIIGIVVTSCFLIAGAGVLRPMQLAPDGASVGLTLSHIFASKWGSIGGTLFLLGGTAALTNTQIGQLAGWPRMLADVMRICVPSFGRRFAWKWQFRMFLSLFAVTNFIIVFTLGLKPVQLVKIGAIMDGLLLTPLQAIWVGIGLYVILPRLFNREAYEIIRPSPVFAVGLALAFLVFAYFCIFQIPYVL